MAVATEILDQLCRSGVRLRTEGSRLIAESKSPLTDDTRALIRRHKPDLLREISRPAGGRWDPEMAAAGYVWCLDCQHWGGSACGHPDNPFRHQQPLAPRKCRWYEAFGSPAERQNG